MNSSNILFYSEKCKYCYKLLQEIKTRNLEGVFKFVCADTTKVPSIITSVPTIVVRQCTKPLVGKDAFNWVANQTFFNIPTNNINASINNQLPKVDKSLSYNKVAASSKYTNFLDEEENGENNTVHNSVRTGYDFGVLKGYKDSCHDNDNRNV